MKSLFDVTALWLRRSLRTLVLLIAALLASETAAFYLSLRAYAAAGLEQVLLRSRIPLLAAVGLLLLCARLFIIGGEFSSRQSYTLRRLSVSPRGGFLARWAACTVCFVILWGAQTAIALWLCFLYKKFGPPELWSPQAVLLALYRSAFLHALLPLRDAALWVRNALVCLALGASAARMPARKKHSALPYLAVLTVCWFRGELGGLMPLLLILMSLIVIAAALFRAFSTGEEEDDAAQTT